MSRLDEIIKARLKKRKVLKERQQQPYPVFVKRTHSIHEVLDGFAKLEKGEEVLNIAGRLMSLRAHGGVTFADLYDGTDSVQIAFRRDAMGKTAYEEIEARLDTGDFISVEGTAFKTKRGEQTVDVASYHVITKSLRPLPEKWHGLKNVEARFRKRYLDLLMNEEAAAIFEKRSALVKELRAFLEENNFTEVETPVLQTIPGGASARPFKTHLNALDLDMYLRVSPELFLKRLLVGGMDKVYELGRNFRNEGVDYSHNPEFTMLEFYWAYSDYKEGMKFTETMLRRLIDAVVDDPENFEYSPRGEGKGKEVDFTTPWERLEFNELLQRYANVSYEDVNFEGLKEKAEELGVEIGKDVYSKAEVADLIYKKLILPELHNPTFVIHYPSEMLPLAKPLEDRPQYAASFQLVIAGWELVKAYSELNDPVVQREFFAEQEQLRKKGDEEAQTMDEDFIEALEYGMPPALGLGMGIDRLAAFLTGAHALREVILFPTMRPK